MTGLNCLQLFVSHLIVFHKVKHLYNSFKHTIVTICTLILVLALHNLTITVPEAVIVGHAVTLTCNYNLEDVCYILNNKQT